MSMSMTELCHDLPAMRLPTLKIPTPQTTSDTKPSIAQDEEVTSECHTPKSEEHKIPAVISCPPAPRKPRRPASCKRKLTELNFFEIVNREDVDAFFRSRSFLKRSCRAM